MSSTNFLNKFTYCEMDNVLKVTLIFYTFGVTVSQNSCAKACVSENAVVQYDKRVG